MKYSLDTVRHSTSHVMAAAVKNLFPKTKLGIGPTIENGFYYDFDSPHKLTESDLKKIEAEMNKIINKKQPFEKLEKPIKDAVKLTKEIDEPYKQELISDLKNQGEKKVSFYKTGDFIDLCKGPHVSSTKDIGYFKLLNIAGAYWKGSEDNPMLTRIYGTAWPTKKDLTTYLHQIRESKKWDHRKIGKELGLFVFSDIVGKGLPMFTAKGTAIMRELKNFIIKEEIKRGYQHVVTPPLAKTELYKISGHYPYYKSTMYPPMKIDEEELILRPMTCPHHFMLYKSQPRSYKELPFKIAEIASQFRYEKSGELTGLMRVRMFFLSDAHIFTPKEKVKTVIKEVLDLIDHTNKILGLEKGVDYRYRLSLGDRTESKKYYNDAKAWDNSEKILEEVLEEVKAPFFIAKNEAAFYGPKIDIQMKDATGKEETAFTIQYDFALPKRFKLSYINEKGRNSEVVVIHRSSIGALERTIALLIEKYKGAFPVWLAPLQIKVLPISDRHKDYAKKVLERLQLEDLRSELDDRPETLQSRIRDAQVQKTPYMLVVGDKEKVRNKVAVRSREKGDQGEQNLEEFITKLKKEVRDFA